jgi:hypothetical protein
MDRDFGTLGVKVLDGVVYSPGMFSKPLAPAGRRGYQPESRISGSARWRLGRYDHGIRTVLGPLPLLGMLSKKDRATVYIHFASGEFYQKTITGNSAVRSAHGEAMQFQALAQAAS